MNQKLSLDHQTPYFLSKVPFITTTTGNTATPIFFLPTRIRYAHSHMYKVFPSFSFFGVSHVAVKLAKSNATTTTAATEGRGGGDMPRRTSQSSSRGLEIRLDNIAWGNPRKLLHQHTRLPHDKERRDHNFTRPVSRLFPFSLPSRLAKSENP